MHVTTEFAALIAQVYPTLVIALLLEGRVFARSRRGRWLNVVGHVGRFTGVLGALASTFLCLGVVGTNQTFWFVDVVVTASSFALCFAFAAMTGYVFGKEQGDIVGQFRKPHIAGSGASVKQSSSFSRVIG